MALNPKTLKPPILNSEHDRDKLATWWDVEWELPWYRAVCIGCLNNCTIRFISHYAGLNIIYFAGLQVRGGQLVQPLLSERSAVSQCTLKQQPNVLA